MSKSRLFAERLLKGFALLCLILWVIEAIALLRLPGKPFAGFRYEATLDVSAINDPSWNGPNAKLIDAPSSWKGGDLSIQQFDRIVSVDGRRMRRPEDLDRYVASRPVGTPIRYRFERDGQTFDAIIPTERMTVGSWFRSFMSLLLPALVFLLVGMAAYWAKPDHPATGPHLLMTCAVALWGVTNNDIDSARLFLPLFPVALPLLPSTMVHLGLTFPRPPATRRRRLLASWLPYLPVALIAIPWAFYFRPEAYWVNPARFDTHMVIYNIALAWVMVGFVVLLALIGFKAWRAKEPSSRRQARIALAGAAIGFLPILLLWGIPYFFFQGAAVGPLGMVVAFGYLISVAFPISIVYDVIRAELFDIRVVIKRTATYALTTAVLAGGYLLLAAALRSWEGLVFGIGSHPGPWAELLATGAVAIAFNPLVTFTRGQIDRIFDREAYDASEILARFNQLTDQALAPDELYGHYFDLVDATVRPQHVSIFVRDPHSDLLLFAAARGINAFGPGYAMSADKGELLELQRAERSGLLARNARTAQLVGSRRIYGFTFYAPLVSGGQVIGRINFGPKRSDLDYSEQDQRLLVSMAHRLADKLRLVEMVQVAVAKARLDQELSTARNIQAALLPAQVPGVRGVDVSCSSRPALEFGGDYYDVAGLDDGRLALAIGDVAGKGLQAALVMAMTKAGFYTLVRRNPDIEPLLTALNQMICETIPDRTHRKTTFCYAVIDREAATMTYACAGHPAPVVFRARTRTAEALEAPGAFPLGSSVRTRYTAQSVPLEPGDAIVFFTDGITEARNPEGRAFFDYVSGSDGVEERDELKDVVVRYGLQPARTIRDNILSRLSSFSGTAEQSDDATLMVVKIV